MRSICCNERVDVIYRPEMFHGCDDGYELRVPVFVCTCCGAFIPPSFSMKEQDELQAI
jgi:hypothetical protein